MADIIDDLENSKVAGFYQGMPAIVVDIQRQPGANVIETAQRIKNELPKLQRAMPVGATLAVVHDATASIRASVRDVQFTLLLSIALVIMVVLIFLRTIRATIIAGVRLPLSLIATFGVMWFCGFSLDNLSLMALTIGTGFVVDDAIVMIENTPQASVRPPSCSPTHTSITRAAPGPSPPTCPSTCTPTTSPRSPITARGAG